MTYLGMYVDRLVFDLVNTTAFDLVDYFLKILEYESTTFIAPRMPYVLH
jgi:hypothetical protein